MMVHRSSSICPSGKCFYLELHICLSDLTVDKFFKLSMSCFFPFPFCFSLPSFLVGSILSFPIKGLSVRVDVSLLFVKVLNNIC